MNKVAHYLQEHLIGEVMTSSDARKYFATDGSIFQLPPAIVVYPRNENDIRKTARFTWQLAERGRVIPLTARGSGTDQSGAALGSGIMLVFPAHMNRILELDGKTGEAIVEPGINFGKLQQTLLTHNRFLPSYPSSIEYSTVGGAVANNSTGEKSVKYGAMSKYVSSLRVVLANGEVIETRKLSKRELGKKLGLATFEGEIYRNLDTLIEEHQAIIKQMPTEMGAAGYAINQVKRKDGSFNLTPLIVGAQGTLGVISEIAMKTESYNPNTSVVAVQVQDLNILPEFIKDLKSLPQIPSAIEMVNQQLLNFVHEHNPNQLKGLLEPPFAKAVLLIEFDNTTERIQKRMRHKVVKLIKKYNLEYKVEHDPQKRDDLWRIRESASALIAHTDKGVRALPLIEDAVVPVEKFGEFLRMAYMLLSKQGVEPAVWGHAGMGNIHIRPLLDLSQVGDRQKAFKLIDDYYALVVSLGGSTSAGHNDGRLRGPYLPSVYGPEVYELFEKVKRIFDPYNTLNPGVKINVTVDDIKPLVRQEYGLGHMYDHLPRT